MLRPVQKYYSKEKANLHLGVTATIYDQKSIWMEGFSRPLWGLVPFWRGGGESEEFETIYRSGLVAGTNPDSLEYWGTLKDYDQKFVEMGAIAYGIIMAPEKIWSPLSEKEKDQLANYLYGINEHAIPICNWQFFMILVNVAMKKVCKKYNASRLEESLSLIESFYQGAGWYQDGDSEQKDYYISFAMHFYGLIYAACMSEEDPERCNLYKERACEFANQFIHWFDEDGAAIPFGRSLAYRFSQVSFWSACLVAGIEPVPVPVMKGLIVRHFDWWLAHPIFDRDGILSIGYGYPNLTMGERYNGPGSPYWAFKTFAFLMLPDEHPFWSIESAPYPDLPTVMPMPYADMITYKYPHHATAFVPGKYSPNGHGQTPSKYGKFAYDTKFGFSISKSSYELHECAPDSMLAFDINGYTYVRRICEVSQILADGIYGKWSPYSGIIIETTIIPNESGHIRTHKITSEINCTAYDCGFSVPYNPLKDKSDYIAGSKAAVSHGSIYCSVEAEEGKGTGFIINADPNTNIIHPRTLIPAIKYKIEKGTTHLTTKVKAKYPEEM